MPISYHYSSNKIIEERNKDDTMGQFERWWKLCKIFENRSHVGMFVSTVVINSNISWRLK